ncbi:MAG TPA: ester cyclase [Chitinophagaceae bacterium]|jgi:limonene-1,2-epoxide hydrolase
MKQSSLLLFIILFLVSCSGTDTGVNTNNIAVIERYAQAVQNKNVDSMAALLADNYIGYGPSFTDSINKTDAIASWKDLVANLYETIQYTRSVNMAAKVTEGPHPGDYVSSWSSVRITYKNGKGPVNLFVNVVYRVENGKIAMSRTFYDEADAMRQLGYQFVPPAQ